MFAVMFHRALSITFLISSLITSSFSLIMARWSWLSLMNPLSLAKHWAQKWDISMNSNNHGAHDTYTSISSMYRIHHLRILTFEEYTPASRLRPDLMHCLCRRVLASRCVKGLKYLQFEEHLSRLNSFLWIEEELEGIWSWCCRCWKTLFMSAYSFIFFKLPLVELLSCHNPNLMQYSTQW